MQRYFFDFQNGEHLSKDEEGNFLNEEPDMRSEAVRALSEMVKDSLPQGEHGRFVVVARDESGKPAYRAVLEFHGEWMR